MRRQLFIIVIIAVVLAGWLAGCTGTTTPGILGEYRRSGGFAGLDDRLVIEGFETLRHGSRVKVIK